MFYLFYGAVGQTDIRVPPVGHGEVEEVLEKFEVSEVVEGVYRGLQTPVNIVLSRVPLSGQIFQRHRSLVK